MVFEGDARGVATLVDGPVDLVLTSPPYMARAGHPQNPLTGYLTLDGDYATYLEELRSVLEQLATLLRPGGHLVLNVADVGSTEHPDGLTPLATHVRGFDLAGLGLIGETLIRWDEELHGIAADYLLWYTARGRP